MSSRGHGIGPFPDYDYTEPFASAFMEHEDDHPYIRITKAHCASWKHSEACVGLTELIVGVPRPHRVVTSTICAGLTFDRVLFEKLMQDDAADTNFLNNINDYFSNRHITDELIYAEKEREDMGLDASIGCGPGFQGHMVIDYTKLMEIGVSGLRAEVETQMMVMGKAREAFYISLLLLCGNISDICEKYADMTEKMSLCVPEERSRELTEISQTCRKIAYQSPDCFIEALQLYWFMFLLDSNDDAGRLDQILYPFYKRDLEKGLITRQRAKIILTDLWYKMRQLSTYGLVLGGLLENGGDASNELTYLCLEITEELHMTHPSVSLRVNKKTPAKLWRTALDCIASGGGMPALINDEAVIRAFANDGIPEEYAWDYAVGGCIEYQISGKSNFGGEDGAINLAKCLDLALHNGMCTITGKCIGPETGNASGFKSFDDFYTAYKKQAEWAAERIIHGSNIGQRVKSEQGTKIFRSLLIDGCIKRGLDCESGGALYGNGQILTNGIIVVADSLCVIKHLVFGQKAITIDELLEAIDNNWVGYENLRLYILQKAPRFGNYDARADEMTTHVARHIFTYLKQFRTYRGGHYTGLVVYYSRQKTYGEVVGATPDGRCSGDVLEDSIGPWPGRDLNGPTAMLSSAAGVPQALAAGGVVLNLKLAPYNFSSDEQTDKSIALIKTYFQMGGQHVQITVVNADDMKQAMLEPEKWNHLIVRVGGYADYFTRLDKALQESIILRTEH